VPTIPIVKQRDYTLSNSSAVGAFAYCPLRFALHGLQMTVTLIQPSSRPDQTNSETRVFCRRHSNIWTKIQNFIILPSLRRKLTPDHGVLNATGVNRLTLVARPPSRLEYFLLARTMPHQKRGLLQMQESNRAVPDSTLQTSDGQKSKRISRTTDYANRACYFSHAASRYESRK